MQVAFHAGGEGAPVRLETPDLEFVPVTLAADRGTTRGFGGSPLLTSVVTIGLPVVQQITEELVGEDEALRQFVRRSYREWQFHLVHLGCSFHARDGMQIVKSQVAVRLDLEQAGDRSQAIVWSLLPQRMERPVDITQGLKVGAKLGFVETTIELTSAGKGSEVFVEAYGLQESDCSWDFRQTPQDSISGTHRLALIARSPRNVVTNGQVTVGATISYRRFKLMPFRLELADQPPITFELDSRR
jgi:hypothetical protein